MTEEELREFLKQGIQRMEKEGVSKKEPLPQAMPEHRPGEGIMYGDWALAQARKRRARRAVIRGLA